MAEDMLAVHDKRLPDAYIFELKKYFKSTEFLPFSPEAPAVYGSISCHPDIYFFQVDHKTVLHAPCCGRETLEKIKARGICLISGEKNPCGGYPRTALYNAARVGEKVFLNRRYADRSVVDISEKKGLAIVDVTQGYTRCSVMAVSGNAFITSDRKIADAGKNSGMDVLEVSPREVELPGEKHGFIGGACGLTPGGEVVILGDPRAHPQGKEIMDFINARAEGCVFTKGLPLYDAGSILFMS
jgi:hypothetical protein